MANKLRNEISAKFAGKERTFRSSWECIANIEGDTKKGIMMVLNEMMTVEFRFSTVVSVLFNGLRGAGDTELSVEEVAQNAIAMGITNAWQVALDFMNAVTGEPDEEGKPEPQPEVTS